MILQSLLINTKIEVNVMSRIFYFLSFNLFIVIFFLFLLLKPTSVYATVTLEVGSGQTYTTIQAAIDAIPSTLSDAYVINIHAGTYTSASNPIVDIASKTTSTSNTITLQASGTDAVILDGQGVRKAIVANVHNVIIKGLQIKDATDHAILLGTTSCNNDQILNNYFYASGNWRALTIIECDSVTVRNNTFYGYGFNGIWNGGSDNTVIDGNTFYRNGSDGIAINTFSTVSSSVVVKNNILADCGVSGSCTTEKGITIAAGSSATLSNNDINDYPTAISGTYTDGGGNITTDPTFLSVDSTNAKYLFIDPTSSLYTAGVGGISMGGRYVATPTNLKQFKDSNSTSQISAGGFTDEKAIIIKGDLSTTTYNSLTPEIEVKSVNQAFDGTNITTGGSSTYLGSTLTSNDTISCLSKSAYHWRMRVKNSASVYSAWSVFGGNSDGNPPSTNADTDFSANNDCSPDSRYSTKANYALKFNLGGDKNLTNGRFIINGENDSKALLILDKSTVSFDTLSIVKTIPSADLFSGYNPDKIKYNNPGNSNYLVVGNYWDYRLYGAQTGGGFTSFGGKMTIKIPYDKDKFNEVVKQSNNTYSTKNLKIITLDKLKNKWVALPYNAFDLDQQTIAHVVDDLSIYAVAIVPPIPATPQAVKKTSKETLGAVSGNSKSSLSPTPIPTPTPTSANQGSPAKITSQTSPSIPRE